MSNQTANICSDSEWNQEPYSALETTLVALVAALLCLLTIVGNVLVLVSFKLDRRLQTVNNYFLLSLAVADFTIGLISMPLFTAYTLLRKWELGPFVCDTWLSVDYLCSNASVLNLLMISFDRYFSVTSPLRYRARRNSRMAAGMIASAWLISFVLWPPWIFAWPYIEGERSVPHDQCYIQFLDTNIYATVGTAVAAFYVPVTVMCALYWRIWKETEKRKHYLAELLAEKEQVEQRTCTSPATDCSTSPLDPKKTCSHRLKDFLITLCNVDCDPDGPDDDSTSPGATTPSSAETPIQSSRATSVTLRPEQLAQLHALLGRHADYPLPRPRSASGDNIYTVMIRLPGPVAPQEGEPQPSVTMISEGGTIPIPPIRASVSTGALVGNTITDHNLIRHGSADHLNATRHVGDVRFIHPRYGLKQRVPKKKQKLQEKKHDKKAAKTLSAILMAFIITWTPYNVLVLVKSLVTCDSVIPEGLWNFAYYLCYINSTINPMCYALGNANFRRTYIRILRCRWKEKTERKVNIPGLQSKGAS